MSLFFPKPHRAPTSLGMLLPQTIAVTPEADVLLLDTPGTAAPLLGLGCVWRLEPVNIEPMDQEHLDALAMQQAALFHGLPLGSCVQTLLLVSPSTTAPAWETLRASAPPHPLLDAQRDHIATGLPHQAASLSARLRTFTTLITLYCPLGAGDGTPGLKALLSRPRLSRRACLAHVQDALRAALPSFQGLQVSLEDTLLGCGHTQVTRLDSVAIGAAMAQHLNPLGKAPTILPDLSLRDQALVTCDTQTLDGGWRYGVYHRDTATFDEHYRAQVLSLHTVPLQTYPGMLSSSRLPRDAGAHTRPMAPWDAWHGPLAIAVNSLSVDQAAEDASLEWKGWIAGIQASFSVRNKEIKDEIDAVIKSRLVTHTEMHPCRVHLVLWGEAEPLARGLEEVQRAAERLSMTLLPEPDLGKTLLLQTVPLGCNPAFPAEWTLKRTRKMERPNGMDLLPLYGGFRGTATPTHFYLNQRGETIGVDLFDSPTNPQRLTLGTSGAGKTFVTGKEVNELLSLGHKVILLDPLRNYRALCAYWNGTYVRMNFDHPPCTNPFHGPMDSTHQAFIAADIKEMAGNADEKLSWEGFNVLSDGLSYFSQTWDRTRGEPSLRHFVNEVLWTGAFTSNADTKHAAEQIARRLLLYYDRGIFAKFVDGPNTFQFGEQFTVIELKELERAEKLQAIIFFNLLHLLPQQLQSESWRRAHKYVKADEVWRFLDQEESAEVLKNFILTFRNIRTSVDFLCQLVESLETPVGKVITGIAEWVLFLKQHPGEFPIIAKKFNLSLDEQALFRQVTKHPTWNTGYLRMSSQAGGIVRILSDPVTHLLMTQEKAILESRERALDDNPGEEYAAIHDWLARQGVTTHA